MNEGEEEFRVVATTAIESVGSVRLYAETWDHIAQDHPEFATRLPSLEHAIIDTLINPTVVCVSTTLPESSVVFASSDHVKGNGHILQVPVRIIGGAAGRVATAMFARHPRWQVIYSRGDDHE
jgi:hypothetical protein